MCDDFLGVYTVVPGIVALKQGARHVTFQDYNEEVVRYVTVPNVYANMKEQNSTLPLSDFHSRASFCSGDWGLLHGLLGATDETKKYDIVLTTDTVYQQQHHQRLHDLLRDVLKPNGYVYVAGKKIYAAGGSISQFQKFVKSQRVFQCKTVLKLSGKFRNQKKFNFLS